jgi:hypothetical protein
MGPIDLVVYRDWGLHRSTWGKARVERVEEGVTEH